MRTIFSFLFLGFSLGCGDGKKDPGAFTLKGKLVEGGKAWTYKENKAKLPPGVSAPPVAPGAATGPIEMQFISTEGRDVVYAKLNVQDGTFEASGLKPGKYKIAIALSSPPPGAIDPFGGKFTSDKTPIIREVKEGDELTIDVSKPGG